MEYRIWEGSSGEDQRLSDVQKGKDSLSVFLHVVTIPPVGFRTQTPPVITADLFPAGSDKQFLQFLFRDILCGRSHIFCYNRPEKIILQDLTKLPSILIVSVKLSCKRRKIWESSEYTYTVEELQHRYLPKKSNSYIYFCYKGPVQKERY
jgi:hypothetical protein